MKTKNENIATHFVIKDRLLFCMIFIASYLYATTLVPDDLKGESMVPNFEGKKNRILQSNETNGEYLITWTINLEGKNSLLDSPYLKAAFEQLIKDFINKDIKCEGELDDSSTSFYNVEIIDRSLSRSETSRNRMKISGSGKCKGKRKRCKRTIKETISDAGRRLNFDVPKNTKPRNNVCETFRQTTLFDSFKNIANAASFFNYNVDVGVIEDVLGNLELDYNVEFLSSVGDSLDEIKEVSFDADNEIKEVNTTCVEPECSLQKSVMEKILKHFDIDLIENQHECVYDGVNCDQNDKVTYIWMGKCFNNVQLDLVWIICNPFSTYILYFLPVNKSFDGKTIPESIGDLPHLKGLFLGKEISC